MKPNSSRFAATLLSFLIAFTTGGWTQTVEPLFSIARSTNANKVYYEARLTKDGTLDCKHPIHAYWILWAKDSTGATREELNEIEKRLAFGFSVCKNTPTSCVIRLAALRDRRGEVRFHGETICAETTISGKPSFLKKIFVVSTAGTLIPRVTSVTLYGIDTASGNEVRETITRR